MGVTDTLDASGRGIRGQWRGSGTREISFREKRRRGLDMPGLVPPCAPALNFIPCAERPVPQSGDFSRTDPSVLGHPLKAGVGTRGIAGPRPKTRSGDSQCESPVFEFQLSPPKATIGKRLTGRCRPRRSGTACCWAPGRADPATRSCSCHCRHSSCRLWRTAQYCFGSPAHARLPAGSYLDK